MKTSLERAGRSAALTIAFVFAGWALGAGLSPAATLHVPGDFSTLQSAINAATSGDSVQVAAGTYVQAMLLSGKDLVILGEGAATTVLTTDGTGRILDTGPDVTPATVISGFTLDNGRAFDGGAIRISNGASPTLRDCRFTRNSVYRPNSFSFGGAISIESGSVVLIEDCEFQGNSALVGFDGAGAVGGAIAAAGDVWLTIRRSFFEGNIAQGFEGGPGGALYCATASVAVDSCRFFGNGGGGGATISSAGNLAIRNSIFRSNASGYGASTIHWEETADCCSLEVVENQFFDNITPGFDGGVYARGRGRIERNTIVFNRGMAPALLVSGRIEVARNIIANNDHVGIACNLNAGSIACNDVWGNPGGNYGGDCSDLTGTLLNISADPVFCDPARRDFRLQSTSPCAPAANSCGWVGALRLDCATLAVPDLAARAVCPVTLEAVMPNPSPGSVEVAFSATAVATLSLEVFDLLGRRQAVLSSGVALPGRHVFRWPASVAEARPRPGVYFAVLRVEGHRQRRSFIVVE